MSDGYLTSFRLKNDKLKYAEVYAGSNWEGVISLIVRCTATEEGLLLIEGTPEVNSALLKHEEVHNLFEYAPGKIIVSVYETDFLLLDNWKCLNVIIRDSQVGNDNKFWIDFMHGFDVEKFPFLVCSGRETFNFINVKDQEMDVLIQAPCRNQMSQSAFFFKREAYGSSMHFCTQQTTSNNMDQHNWHAMPFKADFTDKLKTYRCLPDNTLESQYLSKATATGKLTSPNSPLSTLTKITTSQGLARENTNQDFVC